MSIKSFTINVPCSLESLLDSIDDIIKEIAMRDPQVRFSDIEMKTTPDTLVFTYHIAAPLDS